MKVIWEPKDIRPGTIVGRSTDTERYIIGYIVNGCATRYTLVSLADGLIVSPQGLDPKSLAEALTTCQNIPVEFLSTKFGGE